MKNKKLKVYASILLGLCFHHVNAQVGTNATGGDASSSGGSIAYSVGQVVYTTQSETTGSVAQGVQQPYIISVVTNESETNTDVNLFAYPNPTNHYLMLEIGNISSFTDRSVSYEIYDVNGKLLDSNYILANTSNIKMEQFAKGNYFLKVSQNNKAVKTFTIIKN